MNFSEPRAQKADWLLHGGLEPGGILWDPRKGTPGPASMNSQSVNAKVSRNRAGLVLLVPPQFGLCWEVLHWAPWSYPPFLLSALGLIRMLPGTAFALACVEWAPLGIHGRAHAWAGASQGQSGGDSSRQQGPLVSFSLLDLCSAMTSLLLWSTGGSQHHAGAQALMGRCSFQPERMVAHTENGAVSCGPSTVLSPPPSMQ